MVQSITLFSIFVASPGDVKSERDTLERVVKELNVTIGPRRNARFDLVRWETHSYPAVESDTQEAINKQLGNDHDVVIGIFWGRVGTPTPRATSGTIEELERALQRKRSNPDCVEIMVYFKNDGIPPLDSDGVQLAKLTDLRETLNSQGVLYKKFTGTEFEAQIRIDLTMVLHKCIEKPSARSTATLTEVSSKFMDDSIKADTYDEDAGFDDLFEEAAQSLAKATGLMSVLTQLAESVSGQTDALNSALSSPDPQLSRPALALFAQVLGTYGTQLRDVTTRMDTHLVITFAHVTRALAMALEDGAIPASDATILLENLRGYRGSFERLAITVSRVGAIFSSLPRRTKAINHSRRQAVEATHLLVDKLKSWIRMAESVETMLVNVQEATLDRPDGEAPRS